MAEALELMPFQSQDTSCSQPNPYCDVVRVECVEATINCSAREKVSMAMENEVQNA